MTRSKLPHAGLLAMAAAVLGASGALAQPAAAPARPSECFFITQWQGWKSPSPDVLYLKVNMHDVYRVDLSAGSTMLQSPDVHLVFKARGSDSVCSPLDLDLAVSDGHGFREPLIAKSLVKLTDAEAAAIPPKFRP